MELDSKLVVHNKKKCGRRRSKGVDRISELPDDILVQLLSLLPLKRAAATSVLSRRWSHLWRYTPNLIFKNHDRDDDPMVNIPTTSMMNELNDVDPHFMRTLKNIEWVHSVLSSHKALSLKQFAISFYIHKDIPHQAQVLTEWIHFALSRRVESFVLDLQFSRCILDTNSFTGLRTNSDYKFLKELRLKNLKVNVEVVELFLHSCSLLERLILYAVVLKSDLVVSSSRLKHLEIFIYTRLGESIKVSAPNLTRLDCCYNLEWLCLEDVPNLVEASFTPLGPQNTIDRFAAAAAKLEILTITLDNKPTVFRVPEMPKLKKLVLDYEHVNIMFLLPITRLIQASPCLQEFKLRIKSKWMHGCKFPRILEVEKVGSSSVPHKHLKVFEFKEFCWGAVDHVELLRYMVDTCIVLQEIIITPIPPMVVLPPPENDDWYLDESDCKDNPYLTWAGSFDPDVVNSKTVEAESDIKKWTEEVVASAAAASASSKHLKLSIL